MVDCLYTLGGGVGGSGGSRGGSTISIETPFELVWLAKRLTVSPQLEAVKTAAATFIASLRMCIKGGVVATVHMRPFPNPGSASWGGGGVVLSD